jgi:hypothetical protein
MCAICRAPSHRRSAAIRTSAARNIREKVEAADVMEGIGWNDEISGEISDERICGIGIKL